MLILREGHGIDRRCVIGRRAHTRSFVCIFEGVDVEREEISDYNS